MPVKNAGPYLTECLDSILQQTIENWELIAINDHSDDNCNIILQEYAEKDQRIKPINNDGHGIINALKLALQNSTGNYITRMDADDIMKPKKLELLSDQLVQNGKGSLAVGLVKYFSETSLGDGYKSYEQWLNQLATSKTNFSEIYKECSIPSPAWMLHRDDLILCGAFNHDVYPEDYDLAFRMRAADFKVCPTAEVVHLWRDHPTRSSRTDDNYKDNRFIDLKILHFLKSDYLKSNNLVLWGCGKKGKQIAKLLIDAKVSFQWVSNNPKKIGHDIYGVIIESDQILPSIELKQVIIAIAEKIDFSLVNQELASTSNQASSVFFFC